MAYPPSRACFMPLKIIYVVNELTIAAKEAITYIDALKERLEAWEGDRGVKRSLSHLWELIFNCFNEETLATCELTDIARVSFDELHHLLADELSYTEWPSSEIGSPWPDAPHVWPGPRELMEQYELLASHIRQEYSARVRRMCKD